MGSVFGRFSAKLGPETPLDRRDSPSTKNMPGSPLQGYFVSMSKYPLDVATHFALAGEGRLSLAELSRRHAGDNVGERQHLRCPGESGCTRVQPGLSGPAWVHQYTRVYTQRSLISHV